MSIAEFLDGMPSFDERNFSRFSPANILNKPTPVYISTSDPPPDQIIVNLKPSSTFDLDKMLGGDEMMEPHVIREEFAIKCTSVGQRING